MGKTDVKKMMAHNARATSADEDIDSGPVVGQEDQPEVQPLAAPGDDDGNDGDEGSELGLSPIEVAARAARAELQHPCGLMSGLDVAHDRLQRRTGMWGDVRNFIRRAESFRDILVPMCSTMQREQDDLSRQGELLLYQLERDLNAARTVLVGWALRVEKAKAEQQQTKRRLDGAVDW
jgi:hypothetical protein